MRHFLILSLFSISVLACSSDEEPKLSKEGEACTISSDCETGLVCRTQVCVGTVKTDVGTTDMGGGDDTGKPNNNVVAEDYVLSYIMEISNKRSLFAYDTKTKKETQVSPDNVNCALGCFLSKDLKTFLFSTQNGPAFDLNTLPVTDLVASGTPKTLKTSVRRAELIENTATYVREEGGTTTAYYINLADGVEKPIGIVGTFVGTEGDWYLAPQSKKAVLFRPSLQTMDVAVGAFDETLEVKYTINSENYQQVSGSYFGGNIPTDITNDGKIMAVLTQSAPLNYNACENDSQCTQGPGQICGFKKRCAAIEIAVHFFDLDKLDNLGAACSADDTCGPIHTCDIPAPGQVDKAVCKPRQVKLGLPGEQTQGNPAKPGCELSAGNKDYYYTKGRSIYFGPDNKLYLAAERDCGDQNVPDSGVISLSPTNNEVKVAFGSEAGGFNPDNCYDNVENRVDVTKCTPYISSALISPAGNDVIFLGTNPNVVESGLAKKNIDVWRVKRDGSGKEWLGNHGELDVVKSIRIH